MDFEVATGLHAKTSSFAAVARCSIERIAPPDLAYLIHRDPELSLPVVKALALDVQCGGCNPFEIGPRPRVFWPISPAASEANVEHIYRREEGAMLLWLWIVVPPVLRRRRQRVQRTTTSPAREESTTQKIYTRGAGEISEPV